MKSVFNKFVDNFRAGHAVDVLEDRAAVERHLERLEKQEKRSL